MSDVVYPSPKRGKSVIPYLDFRGEVKIKEGDTWTKYFACHYNTENLPRCLICEINEMIARSIKNAHGHSLAPCCAIP